MLTSLPITAGSSNSGQAMSLEILDFGSGGFGSVTKDAPQARRWRARSGQIGGFRRDVYDSNDQMVPMPVKMATLGIRVGSDESGVDAVANIQNIGWKLVTVTDDVPSTEAVVVVPVPLFVNVADDNPVVDVVPEIRGAQLTVQESDTIQGSVPLAAAILNGSNVASMTTAVKVPGKCFLLAVALDGIAGGASNYTPAIKSLGLTWTLLAQQHPPGSGFRMTAWYAITDVEMSGTFTVEATGGESFRLLSAALVPIPNLDLSNPIAQARYVTPGGAWALPYTTDPFLNPLSERSLVVSVMGSGSGNGGLMAIDSGFTMLVNFFSSFVLSFQHLGVAYRQYNDVAQATWSGGGGGAFAVAVAMFEFNTLGVGDSVTGAAANAYEAFDTPIALEDVTVHVGTNPVVFDGTGITDPEVLIESVNIGLSPIPSVFDTVTRTESVTIQMNPLLVNVTDTDPASEAVPVIVNPLSMAVSDALGETESVQVQISAPGQVGPSVVVFDDDVASDQVAVSPTFIITVFDDNTFPPLDPPPMPATGIARDYIDVQEGLGMGLGLPVLVSDDVPETDLVAIGLSIPVLAADALSPVDVIDTDAVTINPVLVGFDDVVFDGVMLEELVTVAPVQVLSVGDDVAPTDPVTVAIPLAATVEDAVTADDAVDVRPSWSIEVFDDVPSDDAVAGEFSVLLCVVSDDLAAEDVTAAVPTMRIFVDDPAIGIDQQASERSFVRSDYVLDLKIINSAVAQTSGVLESVRRRSS